ncbi:MAG: hypothetical protein ABI602_03665 [Candidatus Saccharibacteria bacterium]
MTEIPRQPEQREPSSLSEVVFDYVTDPRSQRQIDADETARKALVDKTIAENERRSALEAWVDDIKPRLLGGEPLDPAAVVDSVDRLIFALTDSPESPHSAAPAGEGPPS